ncbi:MAG TPA: hypothetical protein PLI11_09470 [Clostridia bacterium]|nr:hypothetical protein [Clostridia bacterium]
MVLDVVMKYDGAAPVGFNVNFMGKTKVVTENNPKASFKFEKKGTFELEIVQIPKEEELTKFKKILNILLLPVIGLIKIFSSFGDAKLLKKLNPYLVSQKIAVDLDGDTEIGFVYQKAEYDKKQKAWVKPSLQFPSLMNIERYEVAQNVHDFMRCYTDFRCSSIAVCFDVVLLFMIIAFIALSKSSMMVFTSFLVLSLISILICVLAMVFVKKRMDGMKEEFLKRADLVKDFRFVCETEIFPLYLKYGCLIHLLFILRKFTELYTFSFLVFVAYCN